MESEKLFELMTTMYKEMQEGLKAANERFDKLEKTVTHIEQTHGQKLEALFDGYIQNKQQLDRIEQEISHQEFVLESIK